LRDRPEVVERARQMFEHASMVAREAASVRELVKDREQPRLVIHVRIAAGSSSLTRYLISQGHAFRHGNNRGCSLKIDHRHGATPAARWVYALALAQALREFGARCFAEMELE
jgi:hypothetical protein